MHRHILDNKKVEYSIIIVLISTWVTLLATLAYSLVEYYVGHQVQFNVTGAGTLILSLFATGFAANGTYTVWKNKRIERFQLVQKYLSADRAHFEHIANSIWEHPHDQYLLSEDNWILDAPENLDCLIVKPMVDCHWKPKKIKYRNLPYLESYSDALFAHTPANIFTSKTYGVGSYQAECGKTPILYVKIGNYEDRLNCCDYRAYELVYNIKIKNINKSNIQKIYSKIFRSSDPFDFDSNFASIGVCALTVIIVPGNPDKSYFLIHNRGKNVAEGKNSYHVVPTGEYQPIQRYDEKGDEIPGLKETIIKEFSEEVLDYGNMGDIYSKKLIENLRDDINAEYYYLGMGLDPLNHKSEILTCMVINLSTSPFFNYWSTISKIKTKIKSNYEGTIEIYPLEDEYIDQFLFNENTIPACRTILSKIKDVGYRNSMNIP